MFLKLIVCVCACVCVFQRVSGFGSWLGTTIYLTWKWLHTARPVWSMRRLETMCVEVLCVRGDLSWITHPAGSVNQSQSSLTTDTNLQTHVDIVTQCMYTGIEEQINRTHWHLWWQTQHCSRGWYVRVTHISITHGAMWYDTKKYKFYLAVFSVMKNL